ncbi:MAG: MBL fold metallo-hydrolase [Candidatus Bathyarchaeota archaeon]|nr:MBL fold metallo-hydrolase [Candidatus Bathyarchaeota archaeon]
MGDRILSKHAQVEILVHCFYHRVGLHKGHPVLSVRWPVTPMPQETVNEVYGNKVFSLGSTNTVLIRDGDLNIVHDPGILQLGRYGTLQMRLREFGLEPDDIDVVINSHCHYDHIEANYLFKGKPLYVHEDEVKFCDRLYWPEFTQAFFGIMDMKKIKGTVQVSPNVKIIETLGHTPGSISTLVETDAGLVALVGDAAIIKEDLLELRAPSVVTKNIGAETAIESLRKIRDLNPVMVVPGHDAPFTP